MLDFNRDISRVRHWTRITCILLSLSVVLVLLDVKFRWAAEISNLFKISSTIHHLTYGDAVGPPPAAPLSTTRLNIELHPEEHTTREPATLEFTWQITSALRRPDGVEKLVYLINGQFPGPTIEARSGDRLVIEVENAMDQSHTAIHWHGLQMRDANTMDGAVGVTQAPIAPGETFTYNFTIASSEYGTFFPALSTVHEFPIQQEVSNTSPRSRRRQTESSPAQTDFQRQSVAHQVNRTIVLYSKTLKLSHLANVPHDFINHTSWAPPKSPSISIDRAQWDDNQLVPQIPYNASQPLWVDIVLNNLDEDSHAWHLHGYSFYVVASHSADFGWGSYNPYADPELPGGPLNLIDPQMRDTVYVPRRGYVILRFRADNPGIWMFHCHMLWHQASGMALALEVGDSSF